MWFIAIKFELDQCEIWKKEFKRKFDLEAHNRIHSNEKPYSCDLCEK